LPENCPEYFLSFVVEMKQRRKKDAKNNTIFVV